MDFGPFTADEIHQLGGLHAAPLLRGHDVGIGRFRLAALDRVLVLQIVVLEERLLVLRHRVHRDQERALLHVDVVARTPDHVGRGRIRAVPLAALLHRQRAVDRAAVALRLVEPADRVVGHADPEHVVRHPAVVVVVGPHARHAALGQLHDLGLREQPPLVDLDRIDDGVVGPGPGGRVEQRHRFVQIVPDLRVPLEERLQHHLREAQADADAVAVVVVLDVLAPVDHRRRRQPLLLRDEIVDLLLASVHLARRREHEDDVVADRLDERRLLDRQPVGQLHQHLGAPELRRMDAAHREVDGLAGRDELLRLRLGQLARIGELRGDLAVLVELLDRRFVGHRDREHVPPLVAHADLEHRHAIRRLVERVEIPDDVLVVGQLAGLTGDVAEEFQRRRHFVGGRHVIDQLRQDARIGRRRLDLGRVVGVELLRPRHRRHGLGREPRDAAGRRGRARQRAHEPKQLTSFDSPDCALAQDRPFDSPDSALAQDRPANGRIHAVLQERAPGDDRVWASEKISRNSPSARLTCAPVRRPARVRLPYPVTKIPTACVES